MSSELSDSPLDTRRLSLRSRTVLLGVVLVALVAVVVAVVAAPRRAGAESLPLWMVGEISLPVTSATASRSGARRVRNGTSCLSARSGRGGYRARGARPRCGGSPPAGAR